MIYQELSSVEIQPSLHGRYWFVVGLYYVLGYGMNISDFDYLLVRN